ncbi:hypothetical protein KIPB_011861, partial [Kipferlia bialata]
VLFVLTAQLFSATQFVIEEKNLKGYDNVSPVRLVGQEGVFGALMMWLIVLPLLSWLPGSDNGSVENELDAFVLLSNSSFLVKMLILYWLSIAFFNGLSLTMSKTLSAVHRTLIDACRTVLVWSSMVAIYHISGGRYGENINQYSWIEMVGFLFLIWGTVTHNNVSDMGKKQVMFLGFTRHYSAMPLEE